MDEFEQLGHDLPVIRDDRRVSGYVRMEQRRGLIGIYEKTNPKTVWIDHCPWEVENELFEPDYERVMPWLKAAFDRMPVLAHSGIARCVHGAISHTPDGNPLIGPAPGAQNYWCCCGIQIGIGWGPGLTRELARWMVHGAADISMREFDPRRFGSYASKEWQVLKAREDYCLRHEIPYPGFNRLAGRPLKPGPLYPRLQEKGAVFEEVCGHERPRWFARGGVEPHDRYSFRRTALHWIVAEECRSVRERVGIMDISALAKVEVAGPGAEALLHRLIANRLPRRVGGIVLAHMLNRAGRIELEATVVRFAADRFFLVAALFFEQRLIDHLNCNRRGEKVEIITRSDNWAALALNGPASRAVLGACTDADLTNAGFPWLSARWIEVGGHSLWALRMSYVGELGWELHLPCASLLPVYDALWKAGLEHGIADYGSFAMNALRMEKAFPGAAELTNEVTLREAAITRFARSNHAYLGRDATLRGKPRWNRAYLEIEPDGIEDGHGGEAVLRNGSVVGSTSSVAYGHSVGKTLAFAYLRPDVAVPGIALEVLIGGKPRAAKVLAEAAHDPRNLLPRTDSGLEFMR